MRLDQGRIPRIVAVQAKCRGCFRQVKSKLRRRSVTASMSRVAGIAAKIERLMPTTALRNIHTRAMTAQAKILLLV
jgi:hypothetical protein